MPPLAVLFDFDGVIVDSLDFHIKAWGRAAQAVLNRPLTPDEEGAIVGNSTNAIGAYLTRGQSSVLAQALIARKRDELKNSGDTVPLLPGAKAMFDYLTKKNIPYGVASNSPTVFVVTTLKKVGLSAAVVLGAEDVKSPKPAPDIYLLGAKRLGLSVTMHSSVLVFEDSTHGLAAARKAGMIPIGVATQHDETILKKAGAKFVCATLAEALTKDWFGAF